MSIVGGGLFVHLSRRRNDGAQRGVGASGPLKCDHSVGVRWRPAHWIVLNAANLSSWLRLPLSSGPADGDKPTAALIIDATGLRESAAPDGAVGGILVYCIKASIHHPRTACLASSTTC